MSFPVINAVSGVVEETAHLATDVVEGTRYVGKMYNRGMRDAYKAQLAESNNEQKSVDMSGWTEAQKAEYDAV
jgi:hypothetical protein